MPTMPNCVGLKYEAALAAMVTAGVRVLPLGYFQIDPVAIKWAANTGAKPGFVSAQSPSSGANVAANSNVLLTVAELPMGVVYPGGGTQV
ncbi:PASTA domain-containing protein [Ralstonia insidiosa]|uniref:PASTA domain-containing protein n=1 Tax=Ralstonia insidiosa TaxID=190721 RepID=UPI000CEF2A09|nr:PASTA domain-containing protein [Ralstonia insidiosa]